MLIFPFLSQIPSLTPFLSLPQAAISKCVYPASRHPTFPLRLTSGCDACRARKVRCAREDPDDPKQSCKHCIALGIPCTYDYQPKKRGPPNLCAILHPQALLFITLPDTCVVYKRLLLLLPPPKTPNRIPATLPPLTQYPQFLPIAPSPVPPGPLSPLHSHI